MFSDLADSTRLSTRLDPEDLRDINRAYQDACAEVIKRFQGYVARYMGDGILAYFGYPKPHEDDAERAARAGLAIVVAIDELARSLGKEKGVDLQVRVGIATGLVVAGDLIGEATSQERAVVGETPNLAARLQALARPGTVVVSDTTRQLAGAQLEFEDLGIHPLKGFAEPAHVWRVSRVQDAASRFEAVARKGMTPFVGRESELGLIMDRWGRAKDGRGQVVLMVGEAGIGKSRAAVTFTDLISGDAHQRMRLQCSPYHRTSSLRPFAEEIAREAGFEREDDDAGRLERLAVRWPKADQLPVIASLLGLEGEPPDLEPPELRDRTVDALIERLLARSEEHALLVLFEDVHWVDPTSLQLLERLVPRLTGHRVLMLITLRPESIPSWATLSHVSTLAFTRLEREETRMLVQRAAGESTLPAQVVDEILDKTDGVPLFAEELTRALIGSELLQEENGRFVLTGSWKDLSIPTTLQDSLMARIDQLEEAKELCQVASVIGREFTHELLAVAADLTPAKLRTGVERLVESGLVFREGSGVRAHYTFKHALVRDVAYETLLRSRREALHAHIARSLVTEFPDEAAARPELLAYHFAAATLPEKALEYWDQASRRARERGAYQESIEHVSSGLECLRRWPDSDERTVRILEHQIELATSMRVVERGREGLEVLSSAELLAGGRPLMLARIEYARGNILFGAGRVEECLDAHRHSLEFARTAESIEDQARALGGLGDAHYLKGRMFTSAGHFKECVDLCREHDFPLIEAANLPMLSWTHMFLGNFTRALEFGLDAVDRARDAGHYRAQLIVAGGLANLFAEMGRFEAAEEQARASIELADHMGSINMLAAAYCWLARVFSRAGDDEEARVRLEQSLQHARRSSVGFVGPTVLGALAAITDDPLVRQRRLSEAEALLDRGGPGHNTLFFRTDCIESSLRRSEWNEVERHADALEKYTAGEPLGWAKLVIMRGRALADFGAERRSKSTVAALERVRADATRMNWAVMLPAVESALAEL